MNGVVYLLKNRVTGKVYVTKKKQQAKQQEQPKVELLDLAKEDLAKPLPYANDSVKKISCVHKLEYMTGPQRVAFMEEAWRVMEDGGEMTVIAFYWSSARGIQDPFLAWPPLCEQSFLYFNKGWREANGVPPMNCDWDFGYGYQIDAETANRNAETQAFWIKHYANTVNDVQVVLTKRAAS